MWNCSSGLFTLMLHQAALSVAVRGQYSTARLVQDIENLYAEPLQDDGVL
jgi:hypothetical protein